MCFETITPISDYGTYQGLVLGNIRGEWLLTLRKTVKMKRVTHTNPHMPQMLIQMNYL